MDVGIDDLLAEKGFDTPSSRSKARELLEAMKLTNPRKKRIHVDKAKRVHTVLVERLYRVCSHPECMELARREAEGRELVAVLPRSCQVCHGRNHEREMAKLRWKLDEHGKHHVLVIGDEASQNRKLQAALEGNGVKCRFVDGAKDLQSRQLIKANVEWADLTVLRGGTRLPHRLSDSYKAAAKGRTEVIGLAHPGTIRMGRDVVTCLSRRHKR